MGAAGGDSEATKPRPCRALFIFPVTGLHKRMVPSLPSAPTEHDQLLLLSKVGLPSPSGARCPL